MPETLLTPTAMKLYGRVMDGLELKKPAAGWEHLGPSRNEFLKKQLEFEADTDEKVKPRLARIYAFSFEGHNYDLPRPAIFLVHGPGKPVTHPAKNRTTLEESGVVARDWELAANETGAGKADLMYWEYDKGDFSLRLDIDTGPLEQILLAQFLGGPAVSGAHLGVSGAHLGVSGAHLGVSGAHLGVSGAHLGRRR